MSVAALAAPMLDGPPTIQVCHIAQADGPQVWCGSLSGRGPITCWTGGLAARVCPDCGRRVCERCRVAVLRDAVEATA